jgi:hypothetical protein
MWLAGCLVVGQLITGNANIPTGATVAFVAAEDNKFWTHSGVDYWGMFRAFVTNLRAGHTKQGASTITQQVVKTFLLTPERTFKRKIQENILARQLETSLTKQEIMTLYMNQIYFGHGRYGIEEAARFYFGKHVGQLNVGEAAMLAGLPQSPENISPRKNPKRAKERQTYVLNQLAAMQKIPIAEAQKWIDAPIQIVDRPFPDLGSAPEWVDMVKRELVRLNNGNEAALETLGATVRTTLDPTLQADAQKALQSGLRAVDKRHGIGRPVRTIKPDKIDAEIARLARKLARGGPAPKDIYEAVVTKVSDDDHELVVDLGDWKAAIVLGGEDDARYNPPDGDGKITEWTEPNQAVDPAKDHRINFGAYSIAINPKDGALWVSGIGERDTTLVRLERGLNPPQSCKAEVYVPPPDKMAVPGSGGVAIGSDGSVWQNWRGAHEILKFDRSKCKVLNGPTATGQQCPEGWTVYTKPGPMFQGGAEYSSTDMLYMTEIDRDNTLGLGKDVVLSGDVNADSFFVVMPQGGQMTTLTMRVPYPLGFAARAGSGRIDDPKAGWKGRGFWSSYSMYTPWHQEGGKGSRPKVVKFQVRPTPLAK